MFVDTHALGERISHFASTASIEVFPGNNPTDIRVIKREVPLGARVYVTSPHDSIPAETTFARAVALQEAGYIAVPHVAVRKYTLSDLHKLFRALEREKITSVLLIAGDDAVPKGKITGIQHLIHNEILAGLLSVHKITDIRFAGHPQGNPNAPHHVNTIMAEVDKCDFVAGLKIPNFTGGFVTQMCFDRRALQNWIALLPDSEAPRMKIDVGLPFMPSATKLAHIAWHSFTPKQIMPYAKDVSLAYAKALAEGAYTVNLHYPRPYDAIANCAAMDRVDRLHFYPFGQVSKLMTALRAIAGGDYKLEPTRAGGLHMRLPHAAYC